MFRGVAKWGGAVARTTLSAEYKTGASTTSMAYKAIASSSQADMPWHLRSLYTTAEAHKAVLSIPMDITPTRTIGVENQLKKLLAPNPQEEKRDAKAKELDGLKYLATEVHIKDSDEALARLKYLATKVHIEDSDKAWAEVYSCLSLVQHDLPKHIQCSLLSEALERGDDNLVISTLQHLLNLGLDINAQDLGGNSVLYLAAIDSSKEVIDFLLTTHADTSVKTVTGETILDVAAKRLVHGDESMTLDILSKLVRANGFTNNDLQVVYDTILATGVTNPTEVGADIMGEEMWHACEAGAAGEDLT